MTNSDDSQLMEIGELLIKAMDNALSKEEFDRLGLLLKSNSSARKHYYDILATFVGMDEIIIPSLEDGPMDLVAWKAMADIERTAPAVILEKPKTPENVESQHVEKIAHKVNRASLTVAIGSLAALILMIFFVNYAALFSQEEVATLIDSVNAQWKDVNTSTDIHSRFAARQGILTLERGLAKLQFDSNAKVVIEGPAKFEITTGDQIQLYLGRIYATVPPEAVGFTIKTFNTKIVDLGTEFGVQVDPSGITELHVLKGKTSLVHGNLNKISTLLTGGDAKKISGPEAHLADIQCDQERFAREINSGNHTIWRGQSVQLADIVGNGNGFGTGASNTGINPITGQTGAVQIIDRINSNEYKALSQNSFIDGIFIPDGKTRQIISSQGHVFEECPPTCGNFYVEIANTLAIATDTDPAKQANPTQSLLIHANLGVTFDLKAIRTQTNGRTLKRFESRLHISELAPREPNCDFWVLVDGKVRYHKKNVNRRDFTESVSLGLSDSDQFLTLVATDGQDPEKKVLPDGFITKSIDSDWCVFADPVLILE